MFLPRSRAFGTLTKLQMVEPNLKHNNNINLSNVKSICSSEVFSSFLFFASFSSHARINTVTQDAHHRAAMGPKECTHFTTLKHCENYLTTLPGANPRTISEHMYNSLDTRLRKRAKNDAATTQHERTQKR